MGIRVRELLRRKGSPYDELGLDPLCVSATCAALFPLLIAASRRAVPGTLLSGRPVGRRAGTRR